MVTKKVNLNTIIGPGTVMEGCFNFAGFTRIDGHLFGDVDVQGHAVVGKSARLKSNMVSESITVGGVIHGTVLASKNLTVLSTGIIIGDCIAGSLTADEGCIIHGRIILCRTQEAWEEAVNKHRDKRTLNKKTAGR